ncbi:hypothetical protein F5884DRAFT_768552 [Xylogone sp. PMI_703]|nr:hypothetical protein F5884DRAFT_768552 [Xylogone sp. PMI_703]
MAPPIAIATTTLSYPLYACSFDPSDSSRLVVGGGGGAGRSGVGNKITVLDASNGDKLIPRGEIDLSKDEDNVTRLAFGQQKGKTTLVYAGINSSVEEQEKGRNQHFRVFEIEQSGEEKESKIAEISRASLFHGKEKDTYQRLMRLSRQYPGHVQLGAVATGLAKEAEIVVFDTSSVSPLNVRGAFQTNNEAVDIDIIQTGVEEYTVGFCDAYDVFVKKIGPKADTEEAECVYVTPASRSPERPTVPKFRAFRWLTPELLLMLTNISHNSGAVLQILRLPRSGNGLARIVRSLRLPSSVTMGTGLALCNLSPPSNPTEVQSYTQFVIAVAAQDQSILLFKVDLQMESNVSMVQNIKYLRTFKQVHPLQITDLAFSEFNAPSGIITPDTLPQHIKLASVAVGNTVVVHTLPLSPVPLSAPGNQSKRRRYAIAISSGGLFGFNSITTFILILLASIAIQSVLEIRGSSPPLLGMQDRIPVVWQEALGRPYQFPEGYSEQLKTSGSRTVHFHRDGSPLPIMDVISSAQSAAGTEGVVYIHDGDELKAHVHDEDVKHNGKRWEDLTPVQRENWKRKLKEAGHWAEEYGESILKGCFWGEVAGAVGRAVVGA